MIKFRCGNCGQKIAVPEIHAGKKGKCPRCKNIVVIPNIPAEQANPPTSQNGVNSAKVDRQKSPFNLAFLDIPPAAETPPPSEYGGSGTASEIEKELMAGTGESEPVGERKLPWIIDIFLYPLSKPGLITIAIIIAVPLIIDIAVRSLGIFGLFIMFPGLLIKLVIGLYFYWYLAECVRDSAAGGLRAPETVGSVPGLGEMFWQLIQIGSCFVLFAAPAGIYFIYTKRTDVIFRLLLAYAVIFFPMGLLSVVMFDSFSGLNPIVLVCSIFSTFLPYCAMVAVFSLGVLLTYGIRRITGESPAFGILVYCINTPLTLVGAHLLGRFYWRYREKLNWDV